MTSPLEPRMLAFALLAALLPFQAVAGGLHQICYQDADFAGSRAATIECRSDDPAISCGITPPAAWRRVFVAAGPSSRTETFTIPAAYATYASTIRFSNGVARTCTVQVGPSAWNPEGRLIGYTTDESGLLMTGVWGRYDGGQASASTEQHLGDPWEFFVVGGGVIGAESPAGAPIGASVPESSPQLHWWVRTTDAATSPPYGNEAYAIGLKIEGVEDAALRPLLRTSWAKSGPGLQANPTATVMAGPGTVVIGGGAIGKPNGRTSVSWPGQEQYLTSTHPVLLPNKDCFDPNLVCATRWVVGGWTATSKDHVVSAPGTVEAAMLTLPEVIVVGGVRYQVVTSVTWATSAVAQHPSAVVAGHPGEYALSSIGAFVDWQTFGAGGNLLWKLLPRVDIAGAEVASKDHWVYSPAKVTGYAIGVKLVALGPAKPML